MQFMRPTRRTTGARVLIHCKHIAVLEEQATETLRYTAVILHNGREIDVAETIDELFDPHGAHVVRLYNGAGPGTAEDHS